MPKSIEEIAASVEAGVGALQAEQKQIVKSVEDYQTGTKAALGELKAFTEKATGTINSQAEAIDRIGKAQSALAMERRMGFNPMQRILSDEQATAGLMKMLARSVGAKLPDSLEKMVQKTSLSEGATPGSTYIIGQLARDVYDVLGMYGQWNTLGVRPLGTKTTTFPVKTARPVASWLTTQGGQISEDTTKAGTSVDATVLTMGVLLGVTRELIEDSEVDVVADVLADFGEACAYRLDWSAFAADGTSDATDGGFTGIFSGGTASTAANGNTTVGALDLEDFVRCVTDIGVLVRRPLKWWMHPTVLAKALLVRDGNGRSIFLNALEAPSAGAIGSILGYPVIVADAAPSTDSAGSVVAVLGDPQGCVIGVRKAFEFASADQFYFDYNKIAFRGLMRAAVKIRAATAFRMLTLAAS